MTPSAKPNCAVISYACVDGNLLNQRAEFVRLIVQNLAPGLFANLASGPAHRLAPVEGRADKNRSPGELALLKQYRESLESAFVLQEARARPPTRNGAAAATDERD